MNEFQSAVLVYSVLQVASLIVLPKWWKAAALPALLVIPAVVFRSGYMADVFASIWLFWGCGYLLLLWLVFGIVRIVKRW